MDVSITDHIKNCCSYRGCKYEYKKCPIAQKQFLQEKLCKDCDQEDCEKYQEEKIKLEKEALLEIENVIEDNLKCCTTKNKLKTLIKKYKNIF